MACRARTLTGTAGAVYMNATARGFRRGRDERLYMGGARRFTVVGPRQCTATCGRIYHCSTPAVGISRSRNDY